MLIMAGGGRGAPLELRHLSVGPVSATNVGRRHGAESGKGRPCRGFLGWMVLHLQSTRGGT